MGIPSRVLADPTFASRLQANSLADRVAADRERSLRTRTEWMSSRLRREIRAEIARGEHSCTYCYETEPAVLVIDHVWPIAKGGDNNRFNLQVLCRRCNTMKGASV